MNFNLDKTDVTDLIYQMALTYVSTHEDMKNMPPDEFCKKGLDAQREFSSIWGNYRVK